MLPIRDENRKFYQTLKFGGLLYTRTLTDQDQILQDRVDPRYTPSRSILSESVYWIAFVGAEKTKTKLTIFNFNILWRRQLAA